MDGWIGGSQMNRCGEHLMERYMYGIMNEWMDGETDRQKDERILNEVMYGETNRRIREWTELD